MNRFVRQHNIVLLLPLLCMLVLFPLRAHAQEYACSVSLPVRIALTGTVDVGFTVEMDSAEGAPLPEENTVTVRGSGQAAFGAITYTAPGDYHYTVAQRAGNVPYMTYDDTVYQVTVRVVNDEGGLAPEIWATRDGQTEKTAELVFANTYDPPTAPPSGGSQNGGDGTAQQSPAGQGGTSLTASLPPAVSAVLQRLPIPQTGDQFPLALLVVVMCAAAAGFGYSYLRRRRPKADGPDSPSGTKS